MKTTCHSPGELAGLFPTFQQLEAGHSVALTPARSPSMAIAEPPSSSEPWLGVTSSGSTGLPKLVWRRWSEIKTSLTCRPEHLDWLWASPYAPSTFAGVQVGLQAWLTSKRVLSLAGDWDQVWRSLLGERVVALSATPTFVDLLLQCEPREAQAWCPIQITLGGEPLRPALGTRLRQRFPAAHFTVIYAAAEFGVLARTHRLDGWYERDSLDRHCLWRLKEGVLEVQRAEEWRSTGDRVEIGGELVKIIGRADSVANVAGTKVSLPEISELAEQVPGVRRAVAVAEPSAITGQVVALRFAVDPGCDAGAVAEALQGTLRQRLRKESWPRHWVVDEVAPGQNAKRAVR